MSGKKNSDQNVYISVKNLNDGLHSYWRSLQNSRENIRFSNEYEVSLLISFPRGPFFGIAWIWIRFIKVKELGKKTLKNRTWQNSCHNCYFTIKIYKALNQIQDNTEDRRLLQNLFRSRWKYVRYSTVPICFKKILVLLETLFTRWIPVQNRRSSTTKGYVQEKKIRYSQRGKRRNGW